MGSEMCIRDRVSPAGHLEEVDLALLGIEEVDPVEVFAAFEADPVAASAVLLQVDFSVAFVLLVVAD